MHSPEARLAALEGQFQTDGIAYLLVQFVDIHGAAKVKLVPAGRLARRRARRARGSRAGRSGGWGRGRTRTT